jgi:hypothetical protein
MLLGFQSKLFPPGLPTEMSYAFLFNPMRATCFVNFMILGFDILVISEKEIEFIKLHITQFSTSPCPFNPALGPNTHFSSTALKLTQWGSVPSGTPDLRFSHRWL